MKQLFSLVHYESSEIIATGNTAHGTYYVGQDAFQDVMALFQEYPDADTLVLNTDVIEPVYTQPELWDTPEVALTETCQQCDTELFVDELWSPYCYDCALIGLGNLTLQECWSCGFIFELDAIKDKMETCYPCAHKLDKEFNNA